MTSIMKRAAAGSVMGGALLFTGALGIASAAPAQVQDGLVNLAIADVTVLEDVNVGVAAQVSALICDAVDVEDVTVLAETVDRGEGDRVVCQSDVGDIVLQQNAPGNSENAPGQNQPGGPGNSENAPGQQGTAPTTMPSPAPTPGS